MRLAQTALIISLIFYGVTGLHAQPAHSVPCNEAGCQPGDPCRSCSVGGGAMTFTSTLNQALLGILPSTVGCDARHKTYRAALRRSTFDKKIVPFIPYYGHAFPCYDANRVCCGPLVPAAECPGEYPRGAVGEEIIEMQEIPEASGIPTPTVDLPAQFDATDSMPSKEARKRYIEGRSVSQAGRTARPPALARQGSRHHTGSSEGASAVAVQALNEFISWDGASD